MQHQEHYEESDYFPELFWKQKQWKLNSRFTRVLSERFCGYIPANSSKG